MSAFDYQIYGDYENEMGGAIGKAKRLADQAAAQEQKNRLAAAQATAATLPAPQIMPAFPPVVEPAPPKKVKAGKAGAAEPGLLDSLTDAFKDIPPMVLYGGAALLAFMILRRR